ncbi:MAG: dihydroorotate dehydrogenase electron transfer subunit [Clostridiales bacterium]|nr:dihydroorotate dehydrogenase electron transfer subunit [Clostridiales bacterium]
MTNVQQDLRIVTGTVASNAEIAESVYEMAVSAEGMEDFVPGQFINVYLDDKSMLLPRPISICESSRGGVTIVYKTVGKGTVRLSEYHRGEPIRVSTPLGNGYSIKEGCAGRSAALVAGGMGVPPMVGLAKALKGKGACVDVFLGFQAGAFLAGRFGASAQNVFVSTDDGSCGFHGNVVELLKSKGCAYDEYFSCGPRAMLKALSEYAAQKGRSAQVSMEERMGCGYGACVGCSCRVMEGGRAVMKRACKDGPVFFGKDVVWG